MKAVIYESYGTVDELEVCELDRPQPAPDEMLVRVRAVSLNGADAEFLTGEPSYARLNGLFRPKNRVLGSDIAGVVEEVGRDVQDFAPGDEVYADIFDQRRGLAEYAVAPAKWFLPKPPELSFEDASALPQAGVIALQATRDVEPGDEVLIVGAGGGMGVFAIQLASARGAAVTAVDNQHKVAQLDAFGADRIVDYAREDYLAEADQFDVIIDLVGAYPVRKFHHALKPGGHYSIVGGPTRRVLAVLFYGLLVRLFSKTRIGVFPWDRNLTDLAQVAQLVTDGELEVPIDSVHPLEESRDAFRRLTDRTAVGKVVVVIPQTTLRMSDDG